MSELRPRPTVCNVTSMEIIPSEHRCRSSPVNLEKMVLPLCTDGKWVAKVGRNKPSCHLQVFHVLTGVVHPAGLDLYSRRRPDPVQAPQAHEGLQSRGQRCSSLSFVSVHRAGRKYEVWIQPTMQRIQLSGQVNVASFHCRSSDT